MVAGQWRLGRGRARHLLARSPSHYGSARPGFHERPSRIARGKQILGAAILGMGTAQLRLRWRLANDRKTTIQCIVFAHPTLTGSLNNLFVAMDSRK